MSASQIRLLITSKSEMVKLFPSSAFIAIFIWCFLSSSVSSASSLDDDCRRVASSPWEIPNEGEPTVRSPDVNPFSAASICKAAVDINPNAKNLFRYARALTLKRDLGYGLDFEHAEAIEMAGKSASLNYAPGLGLQGVLLYEKSPDKAFSSFSIAHEKGHVPSTAGVGLMMLYGIANNLDVERGIELLESAGSQGFGQAYTILGGYHESNERYTAARKYFELAASVKIHPDHRGTGALASMYHDGRGVSRDFSLAIRLYKVALRNGDRRFLPKMIDLVKVRTSLELGTIREFLLYGVSSRKKPVLWECHNIHYAKNEESFREVKTKFYFELNNGWGREMSAFGSSTGSNEFRWRIDSSDNLIYSGWGNDNIIHKSWDIEPIDRDLMKVRTFSKFRDSNRGEQYYNRESTCISIDPSSYKYWSNGTTHSERMIELERLETIKLNTTIDLTIDQAKLSAPK